MSYKVKEIFMTQQGEGYHMGKKAVFCRFSGCNLWSGHEKDREKSICSFCDTDFVGTDGQNGAKYNSAKILAQKIDEIWSNNCKDKMVVFTGGEPLLQLNDELIEEVHKRNFKIAIETNGTIIPPDNIDWICVSPKIGSKIKLKKGNELKLVFPQIDADPNKFENYDFDHYFLQPMDGHSLNDSILECVSFCLRNPKWRLSVQSHKIMGID